MSRKFSKFSSIVILTRPTRNAKSTVLSTDDSLPLRYSHFTKSAQRTKPRKQTRQAGLVVGLEISSRRGDSRWVADGDLTLAAPASRASHTSGREGIDIASQQRVCRRRRQCRPSRRQKSTRRFRRLVNFDSFVKIGIIVAVGDESMSPTTRKPLSHGCSRSTDSSEPVETCR